MKRRDFLKGCMACGAAATLGASQKAWGIGSFEGYPEGMGVLVDLTRCVGCRSCEAACNKEQQLPSPDVPFDDKSVFEEKRRPTEKAYTVVNRYETKKDVSPVYRKIQCNHCNEPACLSSCFVNAYTKTKEGAVIYNSKVCVGCRNCLIACPFNVPGYSYSSAFNPVVKKCIFCYDTRLKNGRPPACVEICPQQVLTFGHRNDLLKIGRDRIREKSDRYVDHIYGEKEVGGTSWLYLAGVDFDKVGFDTTMSNDPILSNVKDFLGIVPMVLTIWPALFTGFHLLATKNKNHADHENGHSEQEDHKP
jgi:Fe-S-cluster-containing dehydrogenase component